MTRAWIAVADHQQLADSQRQSTYLAVSASSSRDRRMTSQHQQQQPSTMGWWRGDLICVDNSVSNCGDDAALRRRTDRQTTVDSWRISSYRRLSDSVRHAPLRSAAAAAAQMRCRRAILAADGIRDGNKINTSSHSDYDTVRYDSVYLTCSRKLAGSQLSLPYGINKILKRETKN